MTSLRLILAVFLTLALALTQGAAAAGRIQRGTATEVVICTGHGGMQTIWLDGQGVPTTPPHDCPDCLPSMLATGPVLVSMPIPPENHLRSKPVVPKALIPVTAPRSALARGPPILS